jgi:hypothetical protein
MAQALHAERSWGSALGDLEPLPEEQLEALLRACRGKGGKQPKNAGGRWADGWVVGGWCSISAVKRHLDVLLSMPTCARN